VNTDFRISTSLFHHPKLLRLRKELGPEGALCLIQLWGFAATNRPGGKLGAMSTADIALAAGWSGDPQPFIDVLVELRWLDLRRHAYYLHGWHEHQQYVIHSRNRSRVASHAAKARWRGVTQKRLEDAGEVRCLEHARSIAESNAPSPAPAPAPNPKRKDTSLADARFGEFWAVYPKKVDKQEALDAWRRIDPTSFDSIIADAGDRWASYGKDDKQFIPGPAKYLRKRKWTDEVIPRNGSNGGAGATMPDSMPTADDVLRSKGLLS
jgi:hypothetical protein